MKTIVRDNEVARYKLYFRLSIGWAFTSTVFATLLLFCCVYLYFAQRIILEPMNGNTEVINDLQFTPTYFKDVVSDIMQLRLTWNPDTITAHYRRLLSLVKPSEILLIRQQLNQEIAEVKKQNITSVFYMTKIEIHMATDQARITGQLVRTVDGVLLKPKTKIYMLKLKYNLGHFSIISIEDKTNA